MTAVNNNDDGDGDDEEEEEREPEACLEVSLPSLCCSHASAFEPSERFAPAGGALSSMNVTFPSLIFYRQR